MSLILLDFVLMGVPCGAVSGQVMACSEFIFTQYKFLKKKKIEFGCLDTLFDVRDILGRLKVISLDTNEWP